jgi:hypothetical protein
MNNIPVLISYSNIGYKDFAYNLLINLSKKLKHHSITFYCLDKKIYEFLASKDFQSLKLTLKLFEIVPVSDKFEAYGSIEYNAITHTKINVLADALLAYKFIHFIDCDVVCMNEPPESFYESYKKFDIVFQFDHLKSKNLYYIWTCTGNTTMRASSGTGLYLDIIKQFQDKSPDKNDQECLLEYFKSQNITDIRNAKGMSLSVYPIDKYTSGQVVLEKLVDPANSYFFHANHVIGNENKRIFLELVGEWYVPIVTAQNDNTDK